MDKQELVRADLAYKIKTHDVVAMGHVTMTTAIHLVLFCIFAHISAKQHVGLKFIKPSKRKLLLLRKLYI